MNLENLNLAYSIMNIDNSRHDKVLAIRDTVKGVPELVNKVTYYDCRRNDDLMSALRRFHYIDWHWAGPRRGHAGVILSTLSFLEYVAYSEYDGVVLFESDAEPHKDFDFLMNKYLPQVPDDWDLFALCTPYNQDGDYHYQYTYDQYGTASGHKFYANCAPYYDIGQQDVCRVYQGYCAVAMMYSKQGALKLLRQFKERGVWSSGDCQILQICKGTEPEPFNGYTIKPGLTKPVTVDFHNKTTIHDTDHIDMNALLQEVRGG